MGKRGFFAITLTLWYLSMMNVSGAAAVPEHLSSVLSAQDTTVSPDIVRDGEPFTATTHLFNHGNEAIEDIQWFPSVAIHQELGKGANPKMETLRRSPERLTLQPNEGAQVSLTFRVTEVGTRQYGLAILVPDRSKGVLFANDDRLRATVPDTIPYSLRRFLFPTALLVSISAVTIFALRRYPSLRRTLKKQIALHLHRSEAIRAGTMLALTITALNLYALLVRAIDRNLVGPTTLRWAGYLFIPAQWIIPLVAAAVLARTRISSIYLLIVFCALYLQNKSYLLGKIPMAQMAKFLLPAVLLPALAISWRYLWAKQRLHPWALTVLVSTMVVYVALSWPWFKLYYETFLQVR